MCKLLPVQFKSQPSAAIEITDMTKILSEIETRLFSDSCNYILLTLSGKMFICEKEKKNKVVRREIHYHPYQHLIV